MTTTSTSRLADSHIPEDARQAFIEDTKDLMANLRYLLELPILTDEQERQVKDITGSLFARCRQVGES